MSEWSCEYARARLPDRDRPGMTPQDAEALEAHLAGCPECAAEAELVRTLRASRPEPPAALAARIRAAVTADVAGHRPTRRAPGPRARWLGFPRWALAAAAALVLALGTGLYWHDVRGGGNGDGEAGAMALGEAALDPVPDPWIEDDDAVVAGAPVLDGLSNDALAALLEEM